MVKLLENNMEKKDYISAEEQLFKVPYAAMGQEVYDGTEIEPPEIYTPKEMARLWSFEHAIRQANEVEERVKADAPQEMWWVVKGEDGNVKQRNLLWRESWHMVDTMRNIAFNMYTGHDVETEEGVLHVDGFVDDPKMKEAADQLLNQIHKEKEEVREFELAELNHMMDLP